MTPRPETVEPARAQDRLARTDPPAALEVEALAHRYGTQWALRGLSFAVAPGTLFGLLGPNGGGKTTLLRILSTLLKPEAGQARVLGLDTAAHPDAVRRLLGVVFQQPALDAELTVQENLQIHGALYGLRGRALRNRIEEMLAAMGLSARAKDRVKTLSGGLKRRTDLCRGLLHQPAVLLLDEPTTGLDPIARNEFWTVLAKLRRTSGLTMLVATHLLEEADACDRIGILDEGRLAAIGAPEDLKRALGEETLWLESADPERLRTAIEAAFGLDVRLVGGRVQVSHPAAHTLLPALYQAYEGLIESATVRKPTLEDVFMVHTEARFGSAAASNGSLASQAAMRARSL